MYLQLFLPECSYVIVLYNWDSYLIAGYVDLGIILRTAGSLLLFPEMFRVYSFN